MRLGHVFFLSCSEFRQVTFNYRTFVILGLVCNIFYSGLTDLIERDDSFDDDDLTNELWDWAREVLVNWPSSTKQRQQGTGRGKAKGKSQQQTGFLARIVLFAGKLLI